ncbi:MAG: protein translocase subunit SecF [Synergistaceae bacterium]|nr:protein translocase subunit SecF [Synergistaceae bacterium]
MSFSIDFMKHRKIYLVVSIVLIAASLIIIPIKGLNFSIDFTGGNVIQVELGESEKVSVGAVREIIGTVVQGNAIIQEFGESAFIIRIQEDEEDARNKMVEALKSKYSGTNVIGFEKVGPVVGAELRRDAIIGLTVALLGILLYITFRFQFRFAVVSVLALMHDAVVVLGAFSLTGVEVNATFIAAILTVVGYSLNATIIILDRIRENWKDLATKKVVQIVNDSINQTMSRTINTTLTMLFPVITLYILGGPVLLGISFALLIGLIIGTYTSICVSTSLICEWWIRKPIK